MLAVLIGLILIVLAFFFERFSARQHRVFSALAGMLFAAVLSFFLTAGLPASARYPIIALSTLAGGALMCWLLVTGLFFGGAFLTLFFAYTFSFVFPLPIPAVYWGYLALFFGICAVWQKHLAAQVLECAAAGLLTALGGGLVIRSFGFFRVFADPAAHPVANLIFVLSSVLIAVAYGIYRVKTHRLEEVK